MSVEKNIFDETKSLWEDVIVAVKDMKTMVDYYRSIGIDPIATGICDETSLIALAQKRLAHAKETYTNYIKESRDNLCLQQQGIDTVRQEEENLDQSQ